MKSHAGSALPKALALLRAPRGARPGPGDPLPDGMLLLLRIVAGEEQALVIAQESTREPMDTLREAAAFYIQQVMFATDSNSYRVLGVDPGAGDERLREHYRWLARWLHPDRNPDKWEVVYAERVNQAWQDLRTPERRLRYDQQLRESEEAPPQGEPRAPLATVRRGAYLETASPGWNLRWLPAAIFGGLGVSAVLIVSLLLVLRWTEPGPEGVSTPQAVAEVSPALPAAPASDGGEQTRLPESVVDVDELENLAASLTPDTSAEDASVSPIESRAVATPVPPPTPSARLVRERVPERQKVAAVEAPPSDSVASVESAPLPTPDRAPVDERDANRLLGHFSQAYANGNLAGMRAMFTNDVKSPRGGLDEILAEYDRLFESSQERSLAVRDVSWFADGATLTIIASYQATVTTGRGRRQRRTHGDLRLDLRREDEQWRIYRMQHDERPG